MKPKLSEYEEAIRVAVKFERFLDQNNVLMFFKFFSKYSSIGKYVIDSAEKEPENYKRYLIVNAFNWKMTRKSLLWSSLHAKWNKQNQEKERCISIW